MLFSSFYFFGKLLWSLILFFCKPLFSLHDHHEMFVEDVIILALTFFSFLCTLTLSIQRALICSLICAPISHLCFLPTALIKQIEPGNIFTVINSFSFAPASQSAFSRTLFSTLLWNPHKGGHFFSPWYFLWCLTHLPILWECLPLPNAFPMHPALRGAVRIRIRRAKLSYFLLPINPNHPATHSLPVFFQSLPRCIDWKTF